MLGAGACQLAAVTGCELGDAFGAVKLQQRLLVLIYADRHVLLVRWQLRQLVTPAAAALCGWGHRRCSAWVFAAQPATFGAVPLALFTDRAARGPGADDGQGFD
jgi:hypothetical protein